MSVKTIVITGPESTGKTTLATQLAGYFNTQWLPEYARSYIDRLKRPYVENDLIAIAKGQVAAEDDIIKKANGIVFLDTSLEVIKIWSEVKYGRCHPWIMQEAKRRKYGLYLLCHPDIPWQFDPQRENPDNRNQLFNLYVNELTQQNTNFVNISGLKDHRFTNAIQYVESYLHITWFANHAQ